MYTLDTAEGLKFIRRVSEDFILDFLLFIKKFLLKEKNFEDFLLEQY